MARIENFGTATYCNNQCYSWSWLQLDKGRRGRLPTCTRLPWKMMKLCPTYPLICHTLELPHLTLVQANEIIGSYWYCCLAREKFPGFGHHNKFLSRFLMFFSKFQGVSRLCISHLCFQVVGWVASFLHSRLETVASEWDFWWVATSSRLLRLSEAPWVFSPANGKLLSSWNQCPVLSGFVAVSNVFGTVSRPQCNSEL